MYLCSARANEIDSTLPRGLAMLEYKAELMEVAAFRFTGFLAEWMLDCFAFGATDCRRPPAG